MRTRSVLNHSSPTRTTESFDGEILSFLHPRSISLSAVLLDYGDRLAAVDTVWRDGVAVQIGDRFHFDKSFTRKMIEVGKAHLDVSCRRPPPRSFP